MSQQELQEHLRAMRTVPLPLLREEALVRAVALRTKGYTYGAIAQVMADYHGQYYSAARWRTLAREMGVPNSHPQMARR